MALAPQTGQRCTILFCPLPQFEIKGWWGRTTERKSILSNYYLEQFSTVQLTSFHFTIMAEQCLASITLFNWTLSYSEVLNILCCDDSCECTFQIKRLVKTQEVFWVVVLSSSWKNLIFLITECDILNIHYWDSSGVKHICFKEFLFNCLN